MEQRLVVMRVRMELPQGREVADQGILCVRSIIAFQYIPQALSSTHVFENDQAGGRIAAKAEWDHDVLCCDCVDKLKPRPIIQNLPDVFIRIRRSGG